MTARLLLIIWFHASQWTPSANKKKTIHLTIMGLIAISIQWMKKRINEWMNEWIRWENTRFELENWKIGKFDWKMTITIDNGGYRAVIGCPPESPASTASAASSSRRKPSFRWNRSPIQSPGRLLQDCIETNTVCCFRTLQTTFVHWSLFISSFGVPSISGDSFGNVSIIYLYLCLCDSSQPTLLLSLIIDLLMLVLMNCHFLTIIALITYEFIKKHLTWL